MTQNIRLCLVLHNHQPIGNFDGVFEQAYQDSYKPFLDVFERYDDLQFSLHTSGPLAEWLDRHHPEYLDRLAKLVAEGRVEVIGGAFYEPILTMIPSRDRVGQIRGYTQWLEKRLGADVRGMWIPERVWEQNLTSDLVKSGIRYSLLDDYHFRNAGLASDELHGAYVTEDEGNVLTLFPGSERLRYLIPFGRPEETIDYLREIAERSPGSVVVFGDDGEKFGTWPDTKRHVYEDGWLERFFQALTDNRDWLRATTLADAADHCLPMGKIYLPDGSYREMSEWVLPPARHTEYRELVHEMEGDERWPRLVEFVRGGYWRNFRVRYPEANEMYCRMLMVSRRLEQARRDSVAETELSEVTTELYRGQCNCSYWHGAFGGIYLPHLRNAVYRHLIAADNALERLNGRTGPWVEAKADDYNCDARQEVRLANDRLLALLSPSGGGHMYELDVRSIRHNLLATLTRRPEAYHEKVLSGAAGANGQVSSIHDRVVFKQEGLDRRVRYDAYPRKSLVDHFYDENATLQGVASCQALERGDFASGDFEARLHRNPDRIQVRLTRDGNAWGVPIRLTKGVTAEAGSSVLEIAYLLEGLPRDRDFHFAVEFNFAGLPAGADDRYFRDRDNRGLGQLGSPLDLTDVEQLNLVDEYLGIDVGLTTNRPSNLWAFPIEAVSQSEGGFELIHQSVAVLPHWIVRGDENGQWSVVMRLSMDTSLATRGRPRAAVAVTS